MTAPLVKSAVLVESGDAGSTANTATQISIGDTFNGRIATGNDRDWLEVTLEAGQAYVFTMWGTDFSSGLRDTLLDVRDDNGFSVASNDDAANESGIYFSAVKYTPTSTGTYFLDAQSYGTGTGNYNLQATTDVFTPEQVAIYLTEFDWGLTSPLRLGTQTGGSLEYDVSGLTAAGRQLAEWALESWSEATGITFTATTQGSADIVIDDNQSGAFAGPDSVNQQTGVADSASVNISTNWIQAYGTTIDSFSYTTYLHEIGHALGMGHPGPYDGQATYGVDNLYSNDSTQMTVMSYFDPSQNPTVSGSDVVFVTPMLADFIAMERLYGEAEVHAGDTTWGANSNVGGWLEELFEAVYDGEQTSNSFYTGGDIGFAIRDTGGTDTLDVSTSSANQSLDLREGQFSDVDGAQSNVTIALGTTVENAVGGSGNDTIRGNAADNIITAGEGDDVVNGGGGTDTAMIDANRADVTVGTEGNVTTLSSSLGDDSYRNTEFFQFNDQRVSAAELRGEMEDETDGGDTGGGNTGGGDTDSRNNLAGTVGDDQLTGTAGNDTLSGRAGDDTLSGGDGDDQLAASAGDDQVDGGAGNDNIGGGTGNDTIDAGDGNDTVGAGLGDDTVEGGTGNDGLFGGGGNDRIDGGAGADNIGASFGNDTVDGDAGDDNIGGGTGRDDITAGSGNDMVGGGEGDDTIDGGAGDDFLAGGGRDDSIDGGSGADRINAGLGSDVMTGGTGADLFIFVEYGSGDTDVITDFHNGTDTMRFSGVENTPGTGLQGFVDALNVTAVSGGTQLSYEGNFIVLDGVSVDQIGTEDFIFV